MDAKLEFTGNEAISMMHENQANAFRAIADHVEKWKYSAEGIIKLLRESADECEAQAMVVDFRDKL